MGIEDESEVQNYFPEDSSAHHFTFKNLKTNKVVDCYNRNLIGSGDTFLVNLEIGVSSTCELVTVPPGKYQLIGFNRQDIWGNFDYDIKKNVYFTATEPFVCSQ